MTREPVTSGAAVRPATADDATRVAAIWEEGWREVHPGEVPAALVEARTSASFRRRAADRVADTLVVVVDGSVVGFVMTERDEVDQVYVAPAGARHRRGGRACSRRRRSGSGRPAPMRPGWPWSAATPVPARSTCGRSWVDEGEFTHDAPGPDGPISVTAHRYVKDLAAAED